VAPDVPNNEDAGKDEWVNTSHCEAAVAVLRATATARDTFTPWGADTSTHATRGGGGCWPRSFLLLLLLLLLKAMVAVVAP